MVTPSAISTRRWSSAISATCAKTPEVSMTSSPTDNETLHGAKFPLAPTGRSDDEQPEQQRDGGDQQQAGELQHEGTSRTTTWGLPAPRGRADRRESITGGQHPRRQYGASCRRAVPGRVVEERRCRPWWERRGQAEVGPGGRRRDPTAGVRARKPCRTRNGSATSSTVSAPPHGDRERRRRRPVRRRSGGTARR